MPNAFESYMRGQQVAMQQGQNALRMEQAVQAMGKDRQLRDILSQAYTQPQAAQPAIPAMGAAPAMGALPQGAAPLPDYPAQAGMEAQPAAAGGMDMQSAINAMYAGGFGPEAMKMEAKQAQARLADRTPSSVREHKYFMKEVVPKGPEAINQYLTMKRANKFLDIGSGYVSPTQADPTITKPVVTRELKPTETQEYISEKAEKTVTGRELGAEKALLADMEATLPNLQNIVGKLSALGKVATYTKAGQATDAMARQAGFKMSKGAVARKEYMSMVSNEILPLLKQTFGAAFTVPEGQELKATLGDPDASPEEKDAVLRSFISSKIELIKTKQRRVGQAPAMPTAPKIGEVQGGHVFIGGDPSNPKSWKKK